MRVRAWAANALLALAAAALTLAAGEIALRATVRRPRVPMHVLCDCPYLYGLNPRRPGISAQGLRDRVFAIPKPRGVSRVLVLGDSIAYGVGVEPSETFAKVLERRLDRPDRRVEVVNTGTLGYTAYNELEYYVSRGRTFQPDVVVVAFCMNDVVDPELHWSGTRREVPDVPAEAIPDHAYHDTHVARILGWRVPLLGRRSEILRRLALLRDPRRDPGWRDGLYVRVGGRRWPTYLSGEDDLGIQVLTDPDSPQWRWLRGIYARLRAAVEADGAHLVVLIVPLAYQLEDGYPFLPQDEFAKYCRQERLACVDVLGAFRTHRGEELFPPAAGDWADIWHPTVAGHAIIADALAPVVERALPPRAGP
jgi:lysophospholipase L1-like esterase